MSRTKRFFLDEPPSDGFVLGLTGGLALVLVFLYLIHPENGFGALVIVLTSENVTLVSRPEPLGYVVAALAIAFGVSLGALGFPRRPIILLGIALVMTSFVGYFLWHAGSHGGFLPGRSGYSHAGSFLRIAYEHVRFDAWVFLARTTEVVLVSLLVICYFRTKRHKGVQGPDRSGLDLGAD